MVDGSCIIRLGLHVTPHTQVYAAFMAQTDYEIGRVLNRIKELGQEDNTLVILMIGDNGASGEGSLQGLANEVGGSVGGVEVVGWFYRSVTA